MARLSSRLEQLNVSARALRQEWQYLRDVYLPVRDPRSIWRLSRKHRRDDPSQGWKIHVSATILSACSIFRLVAPYLRRRGIMFKAPRSLAELHRLNTGIDYGFSQIGKFITIYPPSTDMAVVIASDLHRLTANFRGPVVPYDNRLRNNSCVYYRYGGFSKSTIMFRGKEVEAIARPDGKLVQDRREPRTAVPPWLVDPFNPPPVLRRTLGPLETNYRNYRALTQRGRGGVYYALDISSDRARPSIIKEGRRHGETDLLGRDGFDLIKQEARFLGSNAGKVAGLPRVITTFRADNCFYLVMEYIPGRTLQQMLAGQAWMSFRRLLTYGLNVARIIAEIHDAGWAWLDCKPGNFLCQAGGKLRPVDFEGARRLRSLDLWPLRTTGYFRPEWKTRPPAPEQADLYMLGVSLAQLMTRTPSVAKVATTFARKAKKTGLPPQLVQTIQSLLSSRSHARPSARAVHRFLKQLLSDHRESR